MMRSEVMPFSKHLTWISDLSLSPMKQVVGQSLDRDSGPATLKDILELRLMKPFLIELPENGNDEAFVNCDYSLIS